jgi:hypothetical protein
MISLVDTHRLVRVFRIAEQNERRRVSHSRRCIVVALLRSRVAHEASGILIVRTSECPYCGSPSIYSSRFKKSDLRTIFFLARPFRCGQCWERFYDFVWKKATLPHPTAADLDDLAPFEEPIPR